MQRRRSMQRRRPREEEKKEWVPKTQLGKLVQKGEITDMEQVYEKNMPILEPEIVDALVPELEDEVLQIKMVQRTTDSGRKPSFMVTTAVGNKHGYIGVGTGKGLSVKPTIDRSIRNAKKNIIHIRTGCGSWQCGCEESHSIPFKVDGKFTSVAIKLMPAPKGTGIVAGNTAKKILKLAGIKDVWSSTTGNTRSVFNFGKATIKALQKTRGIKLKEEVGKI